MQGDSPFRDDPVALAAAASPARTQVLADLFVSLADSLVADYDMIDLLDNLTATCVTHLGVSDAVIVLSDGRGNLRPVASSTEASPVLELFEIQRDEGPCLDAHHSARPVVSGDLTAESVRWPHFAPAAVSAGYRAVTAIPLRLREHSLGALNLFLTAAGEMHVDDRRLAQSLADVASIGILHHREGNERDVLVRQLQHALDSRVVIEQAKGMLARTHGIDVDQAFAGLRRYARSRNLKLTQVAADVVAGRIPAESVPTRLAG